jgi:hypothetical protein
MQLEIAQIKELVETVMIDLYTPHVYVTEDNALLLVIGYQTKGTITLDEYKKAKASCDDFIHLIVSKIEDKKTT